METLPPEFEKERSNTPGNSANLGRFCLKDDWVYFCNAYGLYKETINKTNRKNLIPWGDCININVFEETIYFTNRLDNFYLYRINTDGSKLKRLNTEPSYHVQLVDNYLYYLTNHETCRNCRLIRMSLDGKKKHIVFTEHIRFFLIKDNWIYFLSEYSSGSFHCTLSKIHVNGFGFTNLFSGVIIPDFVIYDQEIYFDNNELGKYYGLCKMKLDGTELTRVTNYGAHFINATRQWIFFTDNNGILHRIDKDGSDLIILETEDPGWLTIIGDWIS